MSSLTANTPVGGGACPKSVSCATADRRLAHVGRYFPMRLPPEGRSERGAPIGVLFGRNGGRRKMLPAAKYSESSDDGLAFVRLREDCNTTEV